MMSDVKTGEQSSPIGNGLTSSASARPFVRGQGNGGGQTLASSSSAVYAAPFVPASPGNPAGSRQNVLNRGANGRAPECCLYTQFSARVDRFCLIIRPKFWAANLCQIHAVGSQPSMPCCRNINAIVQQDGFSSPIHSRRLTEWSIGPLCGESCCHVIISYAICAKK